MDEHMKKPYITNSDIKNFNKLSKNLKRDIEKQNIKLNEYYTEYNTIVEKLSFLDENKNINQNLNMKNQYVQKLESEIDELEKLIHSKDEQIEQYNTEINFLRESFINKDEQINKLIGKIKIYEETEQNLKSYKENYSKLAHESKDNKYFVNYYKQEMENKQTEIEYIKKNQLIRKILNPFSYIFLIIKSKSNEISLNLKLYKAMKNSNHFDIGFYLNKNNDLKDSKWEKYLPLELHYICYGFNEKRKFNAENINFDSKKGLLNYFLNI